MKKKNKELKHKLNKKSNEYSGSNREKSNSAIAILKKILNLIGHQ